MPPSGYEAREADAIVKFLRSCSEALEAEARRDGVAHDTALNRECRDIAALLEAEAPGECSVAVLHLTSSFYKRVAELMACAGINSYASCVDAALHEIRRGILDIHVPPGLHLRSRNKTVESAVG